MYESKLVIILASLSLIFALYSCKKVPTLALNNEYDSESSNYRPNPPINLVTFKNFETSKIGISWKGTVDQPLTGYIIYASETDNNSSYKKAFVIDSSQANSEAIYQINTKLLYKSRQEFFKIEAFYVMGDDTLFSKPVYSSVSQYLYNFRYNFTADSAPNFQLFWNHNFINDNEVEVQISEDSISFETIYTGSLEKQYFATDIDFNPNNSFFRFRIITENSPSEFYPLNLTRTNCFEYLGDTFFYLPKERSFAIYYGQNKIQFSFNNNNCEASEIILLEGGFSPERPRTEIKRVSANSSFIEVTSLKDNMDYYFWLIAETETHTSSFTKAVKVRF